MLPPDQYALLDFGEGRRLERFGSVILNRPCPAIEGTRKNNRELWKDIDAIFVEEKTSDSDTRGCWKGIWSEPTPRWTVNLPLPVTVDDAVKSLVSENSEKPGNPAAFSYSEKTATPFPETVSLVFELKMTPFGHIGLFPEQATNWIRIWETLRLRPGASVLNLFGYTGGSTLAAAAAGARVTHVDAAKNIVDWARRNAELSGLDAAPIRWIAEDARKFVRRELRRGCRYDAIILDPPSYGHGTKGEVWRLSRHLPDLLENCFSLFGDSPQFLLLTAHTPGFDAPRLTNLLRAASQSFATARNDTAKIRGFRMAIDTVTGKPLSLGAGAVFQPDFSDTERTIENNPVNDNRLHGRNCDADW